MEKEREIEQVDIVDILMTHFRNGVEPPKRVVLRAYELDINVKLLRQCVEEVEYDRPDELEDWYDSE